MGRPCLFPLLSPYGVCAGEGGCRRTTSPPSAEGVCNPPLKLGESCRMGTTPCAAPAKCGVVALTDGGIANLCIGGPRAAIGEACDPVLHPCAETIPCGSDKVCALAACSVDGGH
jgi:hypothetical protein